MKFKRICSLMIVLVTMFTMLAQFATPVSAIKFSELGVKMTQSQSYDKSKKQFKMTFTFEEIPVDDCILHTATMKAYLYNSSGKCVSKWTNNGNGYSFIDIDEGKVSRTFNITPSTLKSGDYTFKIVIDVRYYMYLSPAEDAQFSSSYKLNTSTMAPGIKFKQMTSYTTETGKVVPRINVQCTCIKGETLTLYIYDEFGNCVYKYVGIKRKTNSETAWFTWNGMTEDGQYPDGKYKVTIKCSNGLSISHTFNFDFPGAK